MTKTRYRNSHPWTSVELLLAAGAAIGGGSFLWFAFPPVWNFLVYAIQH